MALPVLETYELEDIMDLSQYDGHQWTDQADYEAFQAELMAEKACAEYLRLGGKGLRYVKGLLEKPVPTESMRGSDAVKRRSLLHTSFSLSSQYADIIIDKRIILADDVVTTGSTADACARVLKEAGAGRVYVLCFASGSGWSPQYERSDLT